MWFSKDWGECKNQLIHDLLFPALKDSPVRDEVIEKFTDEVEDRLNIGFDAICHCLYTVSQEMVNEKIK